MGSTLLKFDDWFQMAPMMMTSASPLDRANMMRRLLGHNYTKLDDYLNA